MSAADIQNRPATESDEGCRKADQDKLGSGCFTLSAARCAWKLGMADKYPQGMEKAFVGGSGGLESACLWIARLMRKMLISGIFLNGVYQYIKSNKKKNC